MKGPRKEDSYTPDTSLLTYIKQTSIKGDKRKYALYKCRCGTIKELRVDGPKSGAIISCGKCLFGKHCIKHGLNNHPLYHSYKSMMSRCYNSKTREYKWYGGRGVKVCEEWKNDKVKFFNWSLNNGWSKGLCLDKDIIANKMNLTNDLYSPERCQWVTPKKNLNCTSRTHFITYKGITKSASEWSEDMGLSLHVILHRINQSFWDPIKAITTPKGNYKKRT